MLIERTKDQVIIRLPSNVDTEGLQRLVDYLSYKESKARQSDVGKLAKGVKKGWWTKNRSRFREDRIGNGLVEIERFVIDP